jgi:hypothetical protein
MSHCRGCVRTSASEALESESVSLAVSTASHMSEKSANRRLRADDTPYKRGLGVSRPGGLLPSCPSFVRNPGERSLSRDPSQSMGRILIAALNS